MEVIVSAILEYDYDEDYEYELRVPSASKCKSASFPGVQQSRANPLMCLSLRNGGHWLCVSLCMWLAGLVVEASDPPTGSGQSVDEEDREFWAFRRLSRARVPQPTGRDRLRSPVDAFILKELAEHQLSFSPDAQPARLVRRVYFDLIGLPPSPAEVDAYLRDAEPNAYERLIDRLLASPHFGERWGRHWLDIVGYTDLVSYDGDTTGIFGFIEDRWRYRDYVIDALNSDKPYDRFLAEQLAGDELVDWRTAERYSPDIVATLAATGFWRNAEDRSESAKEIEYKWSYLHDTMETFGTSVLGLTLRCARCHDHKHEPIPQHDYYRLLSLITPAFNVEDWKDPKQRAIPAVSRSKKAEIDTVNATINKQIAGLEAIIAGVKRARRKQLLDTKLARIPAALRADTKTALSTPAEKRTEVQRELVLEFGDRLAIKSEEIEQALTAAEKATIAGLTEKIAAHRQDLKTHGWIQAAYDVGAAPVTHLFERGEFKTPGPEVQPGFVSALSSEQTAFHNLVEALPASSGRRTALAQWLTTRDTPASALVARVIVNRIWQHLTGVGIVPTSENLGMSGAKPTHPELLDWLSVEFVENGWRIKRLIKTILMSTVYRQTSRPAEAAVIGRSPHDVDPENHLLWKSRLRRLESEVIRDAMLVASGRFNASQGGRPVPLKYRRDGVASFDMKELSTPGAKWRRSVYLFQRRVYHLTVLGVFDQPVVAGSTCRRNASAVTLQSLSMMNDELALEQAEHFADRVWHAARQSPAERIKLAFRIALSRPPDTEEIQWSAELLKQQARRYQDDGSAAGEASRKALMHLCRVLFNSSEFLYVE